MSGATIAPFFPFRRIKILGQTVAQRANEARIQVTPDQRFSPLCHLCGKKAATVHSWTGRSVRDLDMAGTRIWLDCVTSHIILLPDSHADLTPSRMI
jgi:hypothetical protein